MPKTAVIIPARYASTRFPGKPLAPLAGKPLIRHVYENALGSCAGAEVYVATDSQLIARAVEDFGGRVIMTSDMHPSGTDRIAEAVASIDCDIIVNVQGDEPLIRPEAIDRAAELLIEDPLADIGTLARPITDPEAARNTSVVKAVMTSSGVAIYFSRAPIPWHRDLWGSIGNVGAEGAVLHQHIGIYSYRREALLRFASLEPTPLERIEMLEQLRAIEHGMRIKIGITDLVLMGVDTPEDLNRVEQWLSTSS